MDAEGHHGVARGFIERGHEALGKLPAVLGQKLRLLRGGQDADAEGLREEKHVAGLCAGVRQNFVRVDKTSHGKAVFRLVVIDRMTAGDERARLIDLVIAAAQDLVDGILRHGFRHGHNIQAQLRLAAHGVDVGQGVRRGDLAEHIRVVRDGREKVDGLHERQLVRDLINGRVVALVKADEQIRVIVHADIAQQLREDARADLCAAPGALGKLRQLDLVSHVYTSNVFCPVTFERTPVYSKIACSTPPPMAMALSEAV